MDMTVAMTSGNSLRKVNLDAYDLLNLSNGYALRFGRIEIVEIKLAPNAISNLIDILKKENQNGSNNV